MIIYIPYYLNWLHKEIKTMRFSTDHFDSILQSETTKNFQSQDVYILSSDENVGGSHQAGHLCRWSNISA